MYHRICNYSNRDCRIMVYYMVRDNNKIKIADEKPMKSRSKSVKPDDNDIKNLDDDTRVDMILKDVKKRPWLNLTLRYILSVIVVLIAFGLYFFMTDLFGTGLPTYILFYPAIIIVALLGGFGPGILATIISVLLAIIYIIPPYGQLEIASAVNEVGVVIYTTFGVIISSVSELYRRNKVKAAAYDKERALRQTLKEKEFLANIIEQASQPFAIGYPDGSLGLFNPAFEQLTGYTKDELHTIDWSTKLTPIKWRQMEQQELDELNKSGKPVRYEKEYIRKDGSLVPIELLVSITLDENGDTEYYYSFITDITERKKAEEDLKRQAALLDVSYEAIFSWGYDSGILSWNLGAERLYGFGKKEAIGLISHELLKTEFPIEFKDFEYILTHDKIWTGELTHTTKDGEKIIVESRQQLIRDTSNRNIVIETNRDITERKRAENALKISEQRISDIIESINDYIFSLDKYWNFIYVNENFAEDIGFKSSKLIGKNIWKTVNKLAGTELEKEFRKAMDEREIRQFEWKTLYIESYREFSLYPSAEGITVYGKNITKRKKAEDEIKYEKNRLETILETSPSAVIIVEAKDNKISYLNKRARQIYGVNIEGLDLTSAISKVKSKKSDGSPYPIGEGPSGRALKGQIVRNEEMTLEQPDGTVVPILGSAAPISNLDGEITAAVVIFEDITERKLEENYKQRLLETEQQLTEELSATNEELQATSEELQTSNEELILTRNNLTELVGKLKTSNKELEQFAHVASHDLQEPLRMVASFTQLLERRYKGRLDEDADDYIGFIVEGAQRMKALIDDLLAFSRLNTEPSNYEPILIEVALDDVLFNLRSSIEENNAIITYDPLPTVMGDLSQIRQLFQNLISNAIKFHGDVPPKIHIYVKEFEKEWLFGISDNGIGINHNHQEQIFNIFKRLHTRKDYEGTGIGLAICKSIIERHGGKIWVESEENKGSTFYFTLYKSDIDINSNKKSTSYNKYTG
jgi:PAS domain S-box-containing protein